MPLVFPFHNGRPVSANTPSTLYDVKVMFIFLPFYILGEYIIAVFSLIAEDGPLLDRDDAVSFLGFIFIMTSANVFIFLGDVNLIFYLLCILSPLF